MVKNITRMLGIILAVGTLCSIGSVGAETKSNTISIVNSLNFAVTVAITTGSNNTSSSTIPAYGQVSPTVAAGASIVVTLPDGYVQKKGYTASSNGYTASYVVTSATSLVVISSGGLIVVTKKVEESPMRHLKKAGTKVAVKRK